VIDADAACEYCQRPAVDEYKNKDKRLEPVCEDCAIDLRSGDEMERREAAYDDACDRAYSEWKDEGKVGPLRHIPRRGL